MASRQKKKSKKALPHDPFEEMGELDSLNPDVSGTDGEGAVTHAQEDDSHGKPRPRKVAARVTNLETKPLPPLVGETESAPESEPELSDLACIEPKQVSGSQKEIRAPEGMDSVSMGEADTPPETIDMPSEKELSLTEVPDDVEAVDTKSKSEDGIEDGNGQLLDMLIATIDDEMDATFGSGEGTELALAAESSTQDEQYVIFSLAGTEYAVPIMNVTEIGYPLNVTAVPNVPDWILGVANLRGDLISVVDLRMFFGLERMTSGESVRMLVGRTFQEDLTVGLIVDRAHGIRHLPVEQIEKPTAGIESKISPYLLGTYEHEGHLLVVLDLDRVLASAEMRQFEAL